MFIHEKSLQFICLFVYLFICLANLNAQECGFVPSENYQTYDEVLYNRDSSIIENQCINICFRIARDNNGSNAAIDPSMIPQIMTQLNSKFNPHGIFFNQIGSYDYINNTNFNNYISGSIPENIPNCLNIYFIKIFQSNPGWGGIATFGNLRVTVRGINALDGSLTHEVGHALNLLHTFQCTSSSTGFNASCAESPFSSFECNIRGDKVCDTPADYTNLFYNNNNNPYGLSNYNPDIKNIMSYWPDKQHFTPGQGNRMINSIIGASQLQSIRSYECDKIVGPSKLCKIFINGNYRLLLTPIGTTTYNWNVSGSLQINGPSTNSTVSISRLSTAGAVTSTVTVTLNGTITKTKTIRTRCIFGILRITGVYDWISKDYGNMGLVIPIDPEDEDPEDLVVKYLWEIKEYSSEANTSSNESSKPFFVGASLNEPLIYVSTSNQAIVNWGNFSSSYLITCHEITQSGEKYLISENYVDVGDPKNNPCFKNNIQSVIAPNPVRNGIINVTVNKPENSTPCNYKDLDEPQFFNSELDRINNSITIFDLQGNEIYRNVFGNNEFKIDNVNLISGNNYVVNLYTNEGGFNQQVIIAE